MTPSRGRVALVGFQDHNNLGLGYLAAVLRDRGHVVELIDARLDPEAVARAVQAVRPDVVGFSLIFQYHLRRLVHAARAVRRAVPGAHLTVGGHFPSLCPEALLAAAADLDSVVRFEGERTLCDLVDRIAAGTGWTDTPGLAYRTADGVRSTPARELVEDLDELPYPVRRPTTVSILGRPTESVVASRGCARRCSFCSIHVFYRTAPGRTVRVRDPVAVVTEMRHLHDEAGVEIFLFQDDDFPVTGRPGRRWATAFLDALDAAELAGRVLWKISCRADEVEAELFARMRRAGLFLVYLGIESGTSTGLGALTKEITVDGVRSAVAALRAVGLGFDYGFMLVRPDTTLSSIRADVAFLAELTAPADVAVSFCRMLPYAGTPVRDELAAAGRLVGDIENPGYTFPDARVEEFTERLDRTTALWLGDGLSYELNRAHLELTVLGRLFHPLDGTAEYTAQVRRLTRRSNRALLGVVTGLVDQVERGTPPAEGLFAEATAVRARLHRDREEFYLRHADEIVSQVPPRIVAAAAARVRSGTWAEGAGHGDPRR